MINYVRNVALTCAVLLLPLLAISQNNKLGAWLWYIDQTGFSSHQELADSLSRLGVKRVYVKVADGMVDTTTWPEQTDTSVVNAYKDAGLEVWAWSYNYLADDSAQAQALYLAAKTGYEGFVVDVEKEFNSSPGPAKSLFKAFDKANGRAVDEGLVTDSLPLYCTTWGNPKTHDFPLSAIDPFVDAFMPQTYVENWGSSYVEELKHWIEVGNEEYRSLGATKPLHHIVSTEKGEIKAADINAFIAASGPQTSVWRIPGGGVSQDVWHTWDDIWWNGYIKNMPYFNQYANSISPSASCQNTVVAMALNFFGADVTPDALSEEWGIEKAQTVNGWEDMFNTMAGRNNLEIEGEGTTEATVEDLQDALEKGHPVAVHAYLTEAGHMVLVNGYDEDFYYVHDPAGVWNEEVCGGGYSGAADSSGYYVAYHRDSFEKVLKSSSCSMHDDEIWMHTFSMPSSDPTAIAHERNSTPKLSVMPGAGGKHVRVGFSRIQQSPVTAMLYTMRGQKVSSPTQISGKEGKVTTAHLHPGIYLLRVKGKGFSVTKKVMLAF